MDKRLEEIKERFKAMNELSSFKKLAPTELFFDDLDYLIQQAERVEELRKINKWLEDGWDTEIKIRQISDERMGKLFEQNQRYKQALEEILGLDIDVSIYDYAGDVITIAAEALKGESKWQEGTKEKR
ncbi:hypothetical protein ACDI16_02120 [Oceanobacillus caeni]